MTRLTGKKSKTTGQDARDVMKQSDLLEHVDSTSIKTVWVVDGERFEWVKGNNTLSIGGELYSLEGSTKKHAKKKIFSFIHQLM